jgi:hypothetical protein
MDGLIRPMWAHMLFSASVCSLGGTHVGPTYYLVGPTVFEWVFHHFFKKNCDVKSIKYIYFFPTLSIIFGSSTTVSTLFSIHKLAKYY